MSNWTDFIPATNIASDFISNKSLVTPVAGDFVLLSDTSDSGNLKKANVDGFLSGGGGSVTFDYQPLLYETDPASPSATLLDLTTSRFFLVEANSYVYGTSGSPANLTFQNPNGSQNAHKRIYVVSNGTGNYYINLSTNDSVFHTNFNFAGQAVGPLTLDSADPIFSQKSLIIDAYTMGLNWFFNVTILDNGPPALIL